jgi:hypothetical protein
MSLHLGATFIRQAPLLLLGFDPSAAVVIPKLEPSPTMVRAIARLLSSLRHLQRKTDRLKRVELNVFVGN